MSRGQRQRIQHRVQIPRVLRIDLSVIQKTAEAFERKIVALGYFFKEFGRRRIAFHGGDKAGQRDGIVVMNPVILDPHQLRCAFLGKPLENGLAIHTQSYAVIDDPLMMAHLFRNVMAQVITKVPQDGIFSVHRQLASLFGGLHERHAGPNDGMALVNVFPVDARKLRMSPE